MKDFQYRLKDYKDKSNQYSGRWNYFEEQRSLKALQAAFDELPFDYKPAEAKKDIKVFLNWDKMAFVEAQIIFFRLGFDWVTAWGKHIRRFNESGSNFIYLNRGKLFTGCIGNEDFIELTFAEFKALSKSGELMDLISPPLYREEDLVPNIFNR